MKYTSIDPQVLGNLKFKTEFKLFNHLLCYFCINQMHVSFNICLFIKVAPKRIHSPEHENYLIC